MPKTKKISRKSNDTFTTFRNETLTRKQLSQRIYRANKTWKNAYNFLSEREYKQAKQHYFNIVESVMGKGKVSLGIEGIHDVKKLKLIEQASHKILESKLLNKGEYNKMRKKQIKSLMDKFSTVKEYEKNGKIYTKKVYNLNKKEAELLRDTIFASDEWHHLVDNELFDSDQALKLFQEQGHLQNEMAAQEVLNVLQMATKMSSENPSLSVDRILETVLTTHKPYHNER